jgi:hypothetical protein
MKNHAIKNRRDWSHLDETLEHASGLRFRFAIADQSPITPVNLESWAESLRAQGMPEAAINPAYARLHAEACAIAQANRRQYESAKAWQAKKRPRTE